MAKFPRTEPRFCCCCTLAYTLSMAFYAALQTPWVAAAFDRYLSMRACNATSQMLEFKYSRQKFGLSMETLCTKQECTEQQASCDCCNTDGIKCLSSGNHGLSRVILKKLAMTPLELHHRQLHLHDMSQLSTVCHGHSMAEQVRQSLIWCSTASAQHTMHKSAGPGAFSLAIVRHSMSRHSTAQHVLHVHYGTARHSLPNTVIVLHSKCCNGRQHIITS